MKSILSITSKGINYIDETGDKKFIDFNVCNQNWIAYRQRTENLNDPSNIVKDNCVGQRDICANPIFIEFFTRPFTRFEFSGLESKKAFSSVVKEILSAGWNTIDLS
jgi:hypothetical protein